MSRHAGDGVVEDDDRGVRLVVGDVRETGHAGVHEGGVADDGNGLSFALLAQGLVEAVDRADGSAHAEGHLDGAQGLDRTQGVAADVAQHRDLVLLKGVEQASVGTSRAHDRRSRGNGFLKAAALRNRLAESLCHQVLGELALDGKQVLAGHFDAELLHKVLDDGIQLFHHYELLHL